MLNYGTIKNTNSLYLYYTRFFIIKFLIIESHQNRLTWFFAHFLEYALLFLNENMHETSEQFSKSKSSA